MNTHYSFILWCLRCIASSPRTSPSPLGLPSLGDPRGLRGLDLRTATPGWVIRPIWWTYGENIWKDLVSWHNMRYDSTMRWSTKTNQIIATVLSKCEAYHISRSFGEIMINHWILWVPHLRMNIHVYIYIHIENTLTQYPYISNPYVYIYIWNMVNFPLACEPAKG